MQPEYLGPERQPEELQSGQGSVGGQLGQWGPSPSRSAGTCHPAAACAPNGGVRRSAGAERNVTGVKGMALERPSSEAETHRRGTPRCRCPTCGRQGLPGLPPEPLMVLWRLYRENPSRTQGVLVPNHLVHLLLGYSSSRIPEKMAYSGSLSVTSAVTNVRSCFEQGHPVPLEGRASQISLGALRIWLPPPRSPPFR